jgi:hypothetical protein
MSDVLIAERYRLIEQLGRGGMGRVWLARDEVLRRDVAIKEIILGQSMIEVEQVELVERTLREARVAARLTHHNVVRIYDVLAVGNQPWIVMEYVRSRSLHNVIETVGRLPVGQVARIGLALLGALRAAHEAGVLHRDVKPSNVLLGDDGRVVLTDFGLAIVDTGEGTLTTPGLILGSPQFVAPERALQGTSSREADLWSLGATLYAAVEGHSPYARSTSMATLAALATESPDTSWHAGPLRPVLTGLLRKNPRSRLTAAQVEEVLLAVAAGRRPPRVRRVPSPRRPTQAAALATVAMGDTAPPAPVSGVAVGDIQAAFPVSGAPVSAVPVSGAPMSGAAPTAPVGPARPKPPWRYRRIALAAVLAVALAGVGALAIATSRPTARTTSPAGGASAASWSGSSATSGFPACGAAAPLPSQPPNVDRRALVAGWVWYQDPTGYHIATPDAWTYSRLGTTSCFREPGGARLLSVEAWSPQDSDPVKALAWQERAGAPPEYRRVSLYPVEYFTAGADWEFTFAGPDGPRHAIKRCFLTAPGHGYAILWVTREFDWKANRTYFDMIAASFQPGS